MRRQSGLFDAVITKINDCGSDAVLMKQNEGQEGAFSLLKAKQSKRETADGFRVIDDSESMEM